MPVCVKSKSLLRWRRYWIAVIIGLSSATCCATSEAAGIFVRSADTQVKDRVYRLEANIDYRLTEEVIDALHNGVSLVLAIEIEIVRRREYIWNYVMATLTQEYQLTYRALAQRYVLENINTGEKSNFSSLPSTLNAIGQLKNFPLMDERLFEPATTYTGRLRSSLDIDYLPTPLRLLAYISPQWQLKSEWYVWPIHD